MHELGHGNEGEGVSLLFDCWVHIHIYGYLVGETLAKEALHDFIFMLPSLSLLLLYISGFAQVLGNRGLVGALEVTPATSKYHCLAKAVRKHCPICTFRVKVWDIGE
jgi:hypothetical protein